MSGELGSRVVQSDEKRPTPAIRVIGCDPGKITGLALYSEDVLTRLAVSFIDVAPTLEVWLDTDVPTHIGIERFVITRNTARKTQQTDALKVSGIVESLVLHSGIHTVTYQNMSAAKRFGSPTLMRKLGWWSTGHHATHKNDATSQVLELLATNFPSWVHTHVTPDIV